MPRLRTRSFLVVLALSLSRPGLSQDDAQAMCARVIEAARQQSQNYAFSVSPETIPFLRLLKARVERRRGEDETSVKRGMAIPGGHLLTFNSRGVPALAEHLRNKDANNPSALLSRLDELERVLQIEQASRSSSSALAYLYTGHGAVGGFFDVIEGKSAYPPPLCSRPREPQSRVMDEVESPAGCAAGFLAFFLGLSYLAWGPDYVGMLIDGWATGLASSVGTGLAGYLLLNTVFTQLGNAAAVGQYHEDLRRFDTTLAYLMEQMSRHPMPAMFASHLRVFREMLRMQAAPDETPRRLLSYFAVGSHQGQRLDLLLEVGGPRSPRLGVYYWDTEPDGAPEAITERRPIVAPDWPNGITRP